MNRGIVKLCEIIPGIGFPEPVKKEIVAPKPKTPRVVCDPTREPVNFQAAMIIRPANWLSKPLPPEPPKLSELESLREEVAKLRAANKSLTAENSALRKKVSKSKPIHIVAMTANEPAPTAPDSREAIMERLSNG